MGLNVALTPARDIVLRSMAAETGLGIVTNAGAKMTETEHRKATENGTSTGLSSTQLDGARLLALHPNMTRKAVAKSLGVSVRSIFRWLEDEGNARQIAIAEAFVTHVG